MPFAKGSKAHSARRAGCGCSRKIPRTPTTTDPLCTQRRSCRFFSEGVFVGASHHSNESNNDAPIRTSREVKGSSISMSRIAILPTSSRTTAYCVERAPSGKLGRVKIKSITIIYELILLVS